MDEPDGAMDDWEHIEIPDKLRHSRSSPPPTPTPPLAAAGVTIENFLSFSSTSADFPPSDHESLDLDDSSKLTSPPPRSPMSSSLGASLSKDGLSVGSAGLSPGEGTDRRSGVRGIVRRAWDRLCFGFSVWKIFSTAGVVGMVAAAAALVYVKVIMRRRRRALPQRRVGVSEENTNHMILLIKEKDQRINQLLLQIARMNELISVRRQVPVLRVE
ncbi:hypothetical protein SAY87_013161 [Trapa incisa]|uniref:Transmembrane protein n=1 Tax=Trapa incisa TaxID=236973 RepID=A0AAN7K899_9MYRT|nr:hypothetical protein SAY87_013161 [Trapa incisa]